MEDFQIRFWLLVTSGLGIGLVLFVVLGLGGLLWHAVFGPHVSW